MEEMLNQEFFSAALKLEIIYCCVLNGNYKVQRRGLPIAEPS
jgi:hypothetical protein